jgi:hypothetical protein
MSAAKLSKEDMKEVFETQKQIMTLRSQKKRIAEEIGHLECVLKRKSKPVLKHLFLAKERHLNARGHGFCSIQSKTSKCPNDKNARLECLMSFFSERGSEQPGTDASQLVQFESMFNENRKKKFAEETDPNVFLHVEVDPEKAEKLADKAVKTVLRNQLLDGMWSESTLRSIEAINDSVFNDDDGESIVDETQ